MKIILKEVSQEPKVTEVENNLQVFQTLVGGYIEVVCIDLGVCLVCNEEGKLQGLPVNFGLGHDTINGTAIFVADNGKGDFTDLTDEQIDFVMSAFNN